MKNEIQRWACTDKKCNAFLKFNTHGVEIENNLEHNNHVADDKRSLVRQKLSNSVKRNVQVLSPKKVVKGNICVHNSLDFFKKKLCTQLGL